MSVRERVGALLRQVGEDLGTRLELDEDGTASFEYDDLFECVIAVSDTHDLVGLSTPLCVVGEAARDRLHEAALRLNLDPTVTGGAAIVLADQAPVLTLCRRLVPDGLDAMRLAASLARFVEAAGTVRERLMEAGAEAEPVPIENFDARYAAAGLLMLRA